MPNQKGKLDQHVPISGVDARGRRLVQTVAMRAGQREAKNIPMNAHDHSHGTENCLVCTLERVRRHRPELEQQLANLTAMQAVHEDAMVAHRWFAAEFGEIMNGRDFAVKTEMASRILADLRSLAAASDSNHPEAFCQRCGGRNVVWFAPNEIWNRVDPKEGILCPSCFVQSAEAAGIQPTGWLLAPEMFPAPDSNSQRVDGLAGDVPPERARTQEDVEGPSLQGEGGNL